jgi:signal transduction histidine kinase
MDDIQSDNYLKTSSELIPPLGGSQEQPMAALDELRRAERLMAVSSIASMIAHFVGTPLNVIVGRAGLIRRHPDATEPIIKDALCIQQKVEQVTEKLRSLIDLLTPSSSPTQSDPDALVSEAVTLYGPIARVRNVELVAHNTARGLIRVKRHPTFVILTSLLSLAINEVAPGKTIEIRSSPGAGNNGTDAEFTLVVPGCSFDDPRQLARFDNAPHKSSNGLQVLGVCAAVARNAGGQLQVRNSTELGSELVLQWPNGAGFNL